MNPGPSSLDPAWPICHTLKTGGQTRTNQPHAWAISAWPPRSLSDWLGPKHLLRKLSARTTPPFSFCLALSAPPRPSAPSPKSRFLFLSLSLSFSVSLSLSLALYLPHKQGRRYTACKPGRLAELCGGVEYRLEHKLAFV